MREYEEGYPVDANDRYQQGNHPDPDRENSSNFGFANVKRNAVPGGNKVREDATAYLNERLKVLPYESTEVLFDQRVEFAEFEGMMAWSGTFHEMIESGETYTVTYNGVSYDCVPYDVYSDGNALFIGNKALFGQDDTGEPFAIMVSSIENGSKFQLDIISVNGDTSATVKIEKSVIHTIDPKFLPGGGGGVVIVRDSAMASGIAVVDSDATATMNAAQIAEAIFAGKTVYFLEPNDGTLLPFVYGYRFGDLASGVMTLVAAPDPYALFGAHDSDGYYHRIKVYSDGIYYTDGFSVGS